MPKITSVESQKKNPRRFNIYLDGQFALGCDEDLVVEYRLVPGRIIDQSLMEKLLFEAEAGKLLERMYRLWNIRPRSEREVKDYLRNLSFKRKIKGQEEISEASVELLIYKLKQKGLLSDQDFAKAWVESRKKKYGINRIKQELYQKGIDRKIIEEVLSDETSGFGEEQLANEALYKKAKVWNKLTAQEFKKKAYQFLLRRGFEYDLVESVVENFVKRR